MKDLGDLEESKISNVHQIELEGSVGCKIDKSNTRNGKRERKQTSKDRTVGFSSLALRSKYVSRERERFLIERLTNLIPDSFFELRFSVAQVAAQWQTPKCVDSFSEPHERVLDGSEIRSTLRWRYCLDSGTRI